MKKTSAARSGYGSAVLHRLSLHAANAFMALVCGAVVFALWAAVMPMTLVMGLTAAALFSFLALMLATATIPARPHPSASQGAAAATRRPPGAVVKPPVVPPVFSPASLAAAHATALPPERDATAVDLDGAYAALEAEWTELARLASRRARPGSVLAA